MIKTAAGVVPFDDVPVATKEAPDWLKDFGVDHVTIMVSDESVEASGDHDASDNYQRCGHLYAVGHGKAKVDGIADDRQEEDRSKEQSPVLSQRIRRRLQRTDIRTLTLFLLTTSKNIQKTPQKTCYD